MKVGIISIGDELMNGFTLDTNSSWISRKVLEYESLDVVSKVIVKDDETDIKYALGSLIDNNIDYIFITGGLGPTHDDITKKTLSDFFKSKLVLNEPYYNKLIEYFKGKNHKIVDHLETQALMLENSTIVSNRYGTALGMKIEYKKSQIFVLPGVPREVKGMVEEEILPFYFDSKFTKEKKYITILTTGIYESQLFEILKNIIERNNKFFKVSFLPSYTGVKIRLSKILKNKNLDEFKSLIVEPIKEFVYGLDDDKIVNIIAEKLINSNMTIATAESCTGGNISKMLTSVSGSSNYFKGAIIAYSNCIKLDFLNIENKLLDDKGAVSSEVAIMMAKNIRNKFNVNIGLSTTGISGPTGGSKDKPVGLVYIAIATEKEQILKKVILDLPRKEHRIATTHIALNFLNLFLK